MVKKKRRIQGENLYGNCDITCIYELRLFNDF